MTSEGLGALSKYPEEFRDESALPYGWNETPSTTK